LNNLFDDFFMTCLNKTRNEIYSAKNLNETSSLLRLANIAPRRPRRSSDEQAHSPETPPNKRAPLPVAPDPTPVGIPAPDGGRKFQVAGPVFTPRGGAA
jgi:hypothetical protein